MGFSLFSEEFKVMCGVRQGGILSPILFNIYVDELLLSLSTSSYGCHVGDNFFGCIMYADDLILLSPSLSGLQCLVDICSIYAKDHNLVFNTKKTICTVYALSLVILSLLFLIYV